EHHIGTRRHIDRLACGLCHAVDQELAAGCRAVRIPQLQLWDSNGTAAGGEVLINGVAQSAGQAINVPSGANVVFDAGTSAGTDTLWARLIQNGTAGGRRLVKIPHSSRIILCELVGACGLQSE
ncbi:hypothetical protein, partial [Bradyrhizobium uaiense]|uniref:hypothetical protein n=1 Tax=Bradyrhizobium uaiense TaxID=2594946 RepID=UPI0013D4B7BF